MSSVLRLQHGYFNLELWVGKKARTRVEVGITSSENQCSSELGDRLHARFDTLSSASTLNWWFENKRRGEIRRLIRLDAHLVAQDRQHIAIEDSRSGLQTTMRVHDHINAAHGAALVSIGWQ